MLTDEDRAWLKALHEELWPPKDPYNVLQRNMAEAFAHKLPDPPLARQKLLLDEVQRIFAIVEQAELLTSLFPCGMICGVGIRLYEHEQYPGSGPEPLLQVIDEQLPRLNDRTVYEHMQGVEPRDQETKGGDVRQDVWDLFTRYTHSPRNREWLQRYKIEMQFDKIHYDY